MSILYFDTETNGIGTFRPPTHRLMQLAWIYNNTPKSYLIKDVETVSEHVPHTISIDNCQEHGYDFNVVFSEFYHDFVNASLIVAHNLQFDIGIIKNELKQRESQMYNIFKDHLKTKSFKCTMKEGVQICKLKMNNRTSLYKFPKLEELYEHFFQEKPSIPTHDALNDCYILKSCYENMIVT